jgi:hypothetical protein
MREDLKTNEELNPMSANVGETACVGAAEPQEQPEEVSPLETENKLTTQDNMTVIFGDKEQRQAWTNLDLTSPLGRALSVACFSDSDVKGSQLKDEIFFLRAVMLHKVRIVDTKTGELTDAIRSVLIDKDNRTCSFCSEGIKSGVRNLMSAYGAGPWEPALPIRIKETDTRRGNRIKNIVIDVNEAIKLGI